MLWALGFLVVWEENNILQRDANRSCGDFQQDIRYAYVTDLVCEMFFNYIAYSRGLPGHFFCRYIPPTHRCHGCLQKISIVQAVCCNFKKKKKKIKQICLLFLHVACDYCCHQEVLKCVLHHAHFQTVFVVSLTYDKMLTVMKGITSCLLLCPHAYAVFFSILIVSIQLHSFTSSALKELSICCNTPLRFISCLFSL